MAVSLQSPMVRYLFSLFIFLLKCHHVSADLVIPNNPDIERYLTPRLFSPGEETILGSNFTFPLQDRNLFQRQNSECDPGFQYCSVSGRCCASSWGCCGASCMRPLGECCDNGVSCPAGFGCCDRLKIGNNGCAPLGSMCCRNGNYCRLGWTCCVDSCAPLNAACCKGGGYCGQGNQCVLSSGLLRCCPGGKCSGPIKDNGRTTVTLQKPISGEPKATGSVPESAQTNEPAPTEGSPITDPFGGQLFPLPPITSQISELSLSSTNISFTTTSEETSPTTTTPAVKTTTRNSMGTVRIPKASWWAVVVGIAASVGAVPEL